MSEHYLVATLVITLVAVLWQILLGTYVSWRGKHFLGQLGRIYTAWLLTAATVTSLAVLLKVSDSYSRIWLVGTLGLALVLVTAFRLLMFLCLRRIRSKGRNLKQVLVVHVGASADAVFSRQAELQEWGYKLARR